MIKKIQRLNHDRIGRLFDEETFEFLKKNRIAKIDFAIKRLKEMGLCIKHQNMKWSIQNSCIVIDLVSDEVENLEVIQ